MTFEEACMYCAITFGTAFSYKGSGSENFFICPACGEPIYEDAQADFGECSICGFQFWEV